MLAIPYNSISAQKISYVWIPALYICTLKSLFSVHLQLGGKVRERFGFYDMIWRYFDQVKIELKVKLWPWASGSKQIRVRAFQRGIISQFWSMNFKVTNGQSWRSKKNSSILRSYIVNRCSPSGPGSIPDRRKLWAPTDLQPMDQIEYLLANLKDLDNIW